MAYDSLEKVQMRIAQRLGHACVIQVYMTGSLRLVDYTDLCRVLRVPGTTFLSDVPRNGPIGLTDADIRRRIVRYMDRKAITRTELARRVGVVRQMVSCWLSGKTVFRLRDYLDVCDALKVRHTHFFEWERTEYYDNHY